MKCQNVAENDPAATDNKALILKKRLTKFMTGRTVHMSGPLLLDLCMQDRLILNGVEIIVFALCILECVFRYMHCKLQIRHECVNRFPYWS